MNTLYVYCCNHQIQLDFVIHMPTGTTIRHASQEVSVRFRLIPESTTVI